MPRLPFAKAGRHCPGECLSLRVPDWLTAQPKEGEDVSFVEPIILGVVQGVTEFLPISSSAHLRIVGEFLPSARDPGAAFTAITQIGTEVAVLVYFRRDIARIVSRWARGLRGEVPRNDPDARMGWQIIIGTIPIGLAGYLAQRLDSLRFSFA